MAHVTFLPFIKHIPILFTQEKEEEAAAETMTERDTTVKLELNETKPSPPKIAKVEYPDDAFHMITQLQWEDDVSLIYCFLYVLLK